MKEVKRPWGVFKQFVLNEKSTVKIIIVNPHQELSLQLHKKRQENWYFLTPGIVQLGNKKFKVKKDQLVYIKKNTPHRVIARKNKVEFLEISKGEFNEHDEIRLEDKYGRK
jgi:mannose-6-phosphate isomerase-like protein (cupin superfamily)